MAFNQKLEDGQIEKQTEWVFIVREIVMECFVFYSGEGRVAK